MCKNNPIFIALRLLIVKLASTLQPKDPANVKKYKFLRGSKSTYECIWRGRGADEGSEHFLHTVPMGYTHVRAITWVRRVGHRRKVRGNAPPVESRGRISWAMCIVEVKDKVGRRCRGKCRRRKRKRKRNEVEGDK